MSTVSDLDTFNLRVKFRGTIQSSEFVSTITLTVTFISLVVSGGHNESLAQVGSMIEILEHADNRSVKLSSISLDILSS